MVIGAGRGWIISHGQAWTVGTVAPMGPSSCATKARRVKTRARL